MWDSWAAVAIYLRPLAGTRDDRDFRYALGLAAPQQRLYFLPLPQGQGSFRPAWRTEVLASAARTISINFSVGSPASTRSANFWKYGLLCMKNAFNPAQR